MKILVVQTGFLGDVILSTPVIGSLRELYPDAEIYFLTTPLAEPLLRHHPELKEVLSFDKRRSRRGLYGLWRMARKLRKRQFDMVFSLHKSIRTSALLWLARIPIRYGFAEAKGRFLYTKTAPRKDQAHDVLRNLAILRNVDREPETLPQRMVVTTTAEEQRFAARLLGSRTNRGRIGIAPGSAWATKRWTVNGFTEVLNHFLKRDYDVVIIGGKEDLDIARELQHRAVRPIHNLVGQLDLVQSHAVIETLDLLVTNDSAPLHLASAALTPTVAIFCATIPEFGFGPWQSVSEVVGVENLPCRPCGRHGGKYCPTGTHACQVDLSSAVVVEAAERVLERAKKLRNSERGA